MTIPTRKDFTRTDKAEDDLDGMSAWKKFGGLSIDDAYDRFCDCPEANQEDLMWMGDRAFAFYFPVIERFIRDEESRVQFDGETYILAHCINAHVSSEEPAVRVRYPRMAALCAFVLDGLQAAPDLPDRFRPVHEVSSAWRALQAALAT